MTLLDSANVELMTINAHEEDDVLESISSEKSDAESGPISYEITTYPADFTLEVLVGKFRKGQIKVPGFQRKYVWKLEQGSRLIESFILGLPVPPVFLYTDSDNSLLAIDGQQRLKTIYYFFEGYFGEEVKGKRPIFRLTGLNEKSPLANKTYADLEKFDPTNFNKLNDSVLRALVIKQLNPTDNTSVHHIFERLNTGGTLLQGQEIRNCVYQGTFNDLLHRLNDNPNWRKIFGAPGGDKRQRDLELILRFFALHFRHATYAAPMKDFLSTYMASQRDPEDEEIAAFEDLFNSTCELVAAKLGERPFHIKKGLNAAVFDAVFVALAGNLASIPADLGNRYSKLKSDKDFLNTVTSSTTGGEVVRKRLALATSFLLG